MSEDWDGPLQSARAPTFSDQVPEQHSEHRRPLLRRCPPARAASFQHELSQALCVPRARLVAKPSKELTNVCLVARERARARPALLPHPLTETRNQRIRGDRRLDGGSLDNTHILQVLQEKTSAV